MKIKESIMKYDCVAKVPEELLNELAVGIDDMKAGRVIPHKESMKQIREMLGLGKI